MPGLVSHTSLALSTSSATTSSDRLESATAEPGGIDLRKGGGVMLPLGDRWEIRFGADHDGEVVYIPSSVSVIRF